jgi:hypothetical protein
VMLILLLKNEKNFQLFKRGKKMSQLKTAKNGCFISFIID